MAFVITEKCLSEVYASCQQVCPADCIHFVSAMPDGYPGAGRKMMVIDPDECIDCGACKPECPIDAIVDSEEQDPSWAQINKALGPSHRGQKTSVRPKNETPHRSDNKLVNG